MFTTTRSYVTVGSNLFQVDAVWKLNLHTPVGAPIVSRHWAKVTDFWPEQYGGCATLGEYRQAMATWQAENYADDMQRALNAAREKGNA